MPHWDDIKREMGDGPPYAQKASFTVYHGYAYGKAIEGSPFDTRDAAMKAGAKTVEPQIDEAAYKVADTAYRDHQGAMAQEWERRVRADYPQFTDAVYGIVSAKAWEDGHYAGHANVENEMIGLADFASAIITAHGSPQPK